MTFIFSGNSKNYILEDRFYLITNLFSAIIIFIGVSISLVFFDYPIIFNLTIFFIGFTCAVFYYLGRFTKKSRFFRIPLLIIIMFAISLSWFFNEGVKGSTTFYFFIAIIGFLFMSKGIRYYIVLFVFTSFATFLLLIQYFFPATVTNYSSPEVQILDLSLIFISTLMVMGYASISLKQNLDRERKIIQQQKNIIIEKNAAYKIINQDLLKEKIKAEENDRLKSAFLANMSHEIRTPMNGILGFTSLLKEPNLTGEKQKQYIQLIEKSGTRLLNIINDIVDISKIEAGLMDIDRKDSNINEQIEFIYNFFKPEAESKGLKLLYNNALAEEAAIVKTDREKIFAILTNLVKNAIKYTKQGTIEFGYEKKGEYLEFYVKDTGIGISRERHDAIFERFIQADIENKNALQGAGLGLSIAKAYIGLLGGKIWVESEEGKGSIFYFNLPYCTELDEKMHFQPVTKPVKEEGRLEGLKILIVEDDEISEMLLSLSVKSLSKEIIIARSGVEAIEICRNNPDIDVLLMDIQIPHMNGYKAIKQIRQFNKDVIIIAQTAYGLSGDREKALEAGCNGYIAKPLNKDELVTLIQKFSKKRVEVE